jgi:hypothetical protein
MKKLLNNKGGDKDLVSSESDVSGESKVNSSIDSSSDYSSSSEQESSSESCYKKKAHKQKIISCEQPYFSDHFIRNRQK